ncbi:hypothetical protein C8R44DRAFT_887989 [Mycena epipterygia]|nr:hypothetical protein C8R44DRAFT_887989 [Mycena epipterygia]
MASCTPPTPSCDLSPSLSMKRPWPTLQSDTTKEVLQSVLKVRKTWKTSRGGEPVWPLELEAALLEGLELYQPEDSMETRILGRFPRRNRFISDYIWEKTGKRRCPKQVGSRLQQLRESFGGKKLMHLLFPFRERVYPESAASGDSTLNSPVSPVVGEEILPCTPVASCTVIHIAIVPDGSESPDAASCTGIPSSCSRTGDVFLASDHPRRLVSINPTVSFTSPSPIVAYSRFTVCSEDLILHAETVPLVPLAHEDPGVLGFLYSTRLVPNYWKVILDSPDPTRFTILQEVIKDDSDSPSIVFFAIYHFCYPENTHTFPEHPMLCGSQISRFGMHVSDVSAYSSLASFADPRHGNAACNTALPYSQENSPRPGSHSPGSDVSSLRCPPVLCNY